MKPYAQTVGSGPDIVLLHGWGLHSGVWDGIAPALAETFRVTLIDLPGHGRSTTPPNAYTLEMLASQVAEAAPPHAVWMGWSLGGMVAMQVALAHSRRVAGLILVASTPRFIQGPDWPHALDVRVLGRFSQDLERDYRATVKRFLALQTRGSEHVRTELRTLNAQVFAHGIPSLAALRGGLAILRDADLRLDLADVSCPTLLLLGEHDTFVPLAAGPALVVRFKVARLEVVQGAAHAPFLSHPREFMRAVRDFLHEEFRNDRTGQTPPGQKPAVSGL